MTEEDNDNGIVLCGVCKNVVSTLPVIRAAFEDLAAKAGVPCWAVFYENNSDDGTDAELLKWAAEAPDQVRVKCEKFTKEEELSRCVARTCDNQPCRMERIAFARNQLLRELRSPNPSSSGNYVPRTPPHQGTTFNTVAFGPDPLLIRELRAKRSAPTPFFSGELRSPNPSSGGKDTGKCNEGGVWGTVGSLPRYVVMIDMDNPVPFPVDAILKCIARDPDGFDALVCNGLNSAGYIYDTYAYRDAQFPFGPEIMRDVFWSGHHQYYMQTAVHNQTLFFKRQIKQTPARLPYIPITSGFNGLCIFRWDAIMGGMRPPCDPLGNSIDQPLRYSAVPTAEMNAEYEALYSIPPFSNTMVNGASVGIHLFPNDNDKDKGIFYFHNSGYNFPVVCEHVPFFAAMRANNHRRIYLCTDLVWNWI